MKVIKLEGVSNVRDLGGTPITGKRIVAPGLLYRGSALAAATDKDKVTLFDELGIRCVIDLRTGWERNEQPDVMQAGVDNMHIPFYDSEIVGIEYTEPAEGTKVVGRDVACNPDRFYRSLANPLTVAQMKKCVRETFAHIMNGEPTYIHCSGGKDRAGVLTLLLLTVLGAENEAILDDYLFTNVSRDSHYDKMLERFLRFTQGDEAQARVLVDAHRARPENVAAFYEAIDEAYGSMEAFVCNQLDIDETYRTEVREACTIAAGA